MARCTGSFPITAAWAALAGTAILATLGVSGADDPAPSPGEAAPASDVSFGRDVRPILADRCFKCHGPDEAVREQTGGLRLDSFEGATADLGGGRHALVPGDAQASEILRRLRSRDPDVRMPPPESKLTVSEGEIATIERWIAGGGAYEVHWAFEAPTRPNAPSVADEAWVRNPIDRFVLAQLERRGIAPSPEADRETLIRRASLDLTGLPPTPEEIDAFLADDRPDAYERVVDRLLASPHYGERMAMYWLDVSRYADTNGYHHDNYRSMWPWRDYVIESFNENKPFDRFVAEQLAGDLLPDRDEETVIATGFGRLHPISDEGGAIEAEYLTEYAADRVETVSTALLGLTMQCSRCHDHKYDPVTQEDYFSLFAFFNSLNERGVPAREEGVVNKAFAPYVAAPTDEQEAELARLDEAIGVAQAAIDEPIPGLAEQQAAWESSVREAAGVRWAEASIDDARSEGGATLSVLEDGSVLASGENPDRDIHAITLRTTATDLRLLRLDVLEDASLPTEGPGRAYNGNGVLSGVDLEAVSLADPEQHRTIDIAYAWADLEQPNGDFDADNVRRTDDPLGWAIDAHNRTGTRTLILEAAEPFGFEGGTEVRVRLRYESQYAQHTFGRVRLALGTGDRVRDVLPVDFRPWCLAGPFKEETATAAYETGHGPESAASIDLGAMFGEGEQRWSFKPEYKDGTPNPLNGTNSAFYLGRTIFAPAERSFTLSLGSDDAIRVYLNGEELLANDTRRGVAPDQESLDVTLRPGENTLVLKIVNEGGPAGFYFAATPTSDEPMSLAPLALIPRDRRAPDTLAAVDEAYRIEQSPEYASRVETLASLNEERATLRSSLPNVMVMEERPEPTPTFVLARGAYDHPDKERPVTRRPPDVLGAWAEDMPRNRLGLAEWLFAPDQPLTARVAVNRFWQQIFGIGIVRTSEDFGIQGEWPSHPELLDWLAVEFEASGWDVKAMLRLIVTSATYRQSSALRHELAEADPENRLLARGPRRRMSAEMIRDNALAASGLLVPAIGGPSVKPYQPDGLWRERAMLTSNTRIFERDSGDDLYRRGLYTFWKRSAPPPQMATFDAPEREYCVVRRGATSTPLQALVLLNDETYVEIARALAQRSMIEGHWSEDPAGSIVRAFRLATGRRPGPDEVAILQRTYVNAFERYRDAPEDAAAVLMYGESPVDGSLDEAELAAMTMVAAVILNLDETITKD